MALDMPKKVTRVLLNFPPKKMVQRQRKGGRGSPLLAIILQ